LPWLSFSPWLLYIPTVRTKASDTPLPSDLVGSYEGTWVDVYVKRTYWSRDFSLEIRQDGTGSYCWKADPYDQNMGCSPLTSVESSKDKWVVKYKTNPDARITVDLKKGILYWAGPKVPENRPLQSPLKRKSAN